jgi:hypothetical protein
MLDIFSRKAVRWEVHATETGDLAKEFIENAIKGYGGTRPGADDRDKLLPRHEHHRWPGTSVNTACQVPMNAVVV